ncbi:MAG: site-specific DNA-methyltransferase, partial [Clostridiales Family XIII bacterium]|nr:site-specific DNA-methyltransferase [Clostridiales Family XIII bacterium]
KIDLIYIDPPFNTNQIFTVENGIQSKRVSTISRGISPHSAKNDVLIAYSDKMPLNEYIEFIRERLILLKELLSDNGSFYFHIDNKMGHYIKIIMDEIFGVDNFKNDICRKKSNPKNFMRKAYGNQKDVILFYVKNKNDNIFNNITIKLDETDKLRNFKKIDKDGRRYNTVPVHAPGVTLNGKTGGRWRDMLPPPGRHFRTSPDKLDKLDEQGLIEWSKTGVPRIKKYADEHKGKKIQDIWNYIDPAYPLYPTEKNLNMLEMIILQSTNPESIILDCFAGSGSTLLAAQNHGRKWIGIDQSLFSEKVIKNRFKEIDYNFIEII